MGTHTSARHRPSGHPGFARTGALSLVVMGVTLAGLTIGSTGAYAATRVGLGTADSYVVLGGQSVTNTGPSTLDGDLGVAPGTSITGFPPGLVLPGSTTHQTDAHAVQAQVDLTTAYNSAAAQAPDVTVSTDLGGQTLVEGVYFSASTAGLTGTVTLDAQGDAGAVWVFQVGSDLTTATGSVVALANGAQACNVYWQVGASATLGTGSSFVGTVMALTSVTVTTGTVVEGRALARNGSVTLDNNVFTDPRCADADGDGVDDVDAGEDGDDGEGTPGTGTPGTPGTGTPGTPVPPVTPGTPVTPVTPVAPADGGLATPGGSGTPGVPSVTALAEGSVPFLLRSAVAARRGSSAASSADALAQTGQSGSSEWMLLPAGILVVLGVVAVTVGRKVRRPAGSN